MPRLPHSLLLRAFKISPILPLVLRGTRTLDSAINEFRWLREHVESSKLPCPRASRKRLLTLCKRRSRAEPLQYILSSQPFGELDIKCRPGVLIPRPETEAYTTHLAELLVTGQLDEQLRLPAPGVRRGKAVTPKKELSILDVCSGSGCIALLLHSMLKKSGKFPHLKTRGLDISPQAVALANENLARNAKNGHFSISAFRIKDEGSREHDAELRTALGGDPSSSHHLQHRGGGRKFRCHDVLLYLSRLRGKEAKISLSGADKPVHFATHDIFTSLPRSLGDPSIIISNPPYISQSAFMKETTRSVRVYEPKLALVPDSEAYPKSHRKMERYEAWKSGSTSSVYSWTPDDAEVEKKGKKKKGDMEVDPADIFYRQLLKIYDWKGSKILLMEVGDAEQALRVVKLALSKHHIAKTNRFEIWRDYPAQSSQTGEETSLDVEGRTIPIKGAGKMRAIVLFRVEEKREKPDREERWDEVPLAYPKSPVATI